MKHFNVFRIVVVTRLSERDARMLNRLGWPRRDKSGGKTADTAEGVAERGAGAGWIEGNGGEGRFAR